MLSILVIQHRMLTSVGAENFEWVVEESNNYCCGKKKKAGK
jgi:hypothetical protein